MATGAPQLLRESDLPKIPSAPAPYLASGSEREFRWQRRPVLRAGIRLAVVVAPAAASAGAAVAFSHAVAMPAGVLETVAWWAVFTAAIVATWMATSELLQRTLPLATLLDLTLAFPYAVPSRLAILRRNIDRRQLEADLSILRERSDPESGLRAQLILEFAVALSIHDSRTRGHSERVRLYTDLIAQQLHLRPADADRLRWAALLHDIGKLAVAPEILNKPERPDDEELESLRNHPLEGFRLIAPLHRWLGPWAAAVRDHHERYDGHGYPTGLSGRSISLGGRIVAVADSFEAMTAGRPYRKALSLKAAREELVRRSGTHFDPYVVRALLAASVNRLWPLVAIGAVITQVPVLARFSWRVSQAGPRVASGFVAAAATATLVVAGVAAPTAVQFVQGPASGSAHVANVTAGGLPQPVVAPPLAVPPSPAAPPSGTSKLIPPAASQPAPPSPATPPPSPARAKKSLYPAGIAKHATLPQGIAKQTNPFAQWQQHH